MNVYQKNYNPEFIKELPVDFNKIKNMNLSTIPEKYQVLFTTDWNWGRYSNMPMSQRMVYQNLFLEYQHEEVLEKIINKLQEEVEEKEIVGFPND